MTCFDLGSFIEGASALVLLLFFGAALLPSPECRHCGRKQ